MRLWLKQRFAHLILLPSPKNPTVKRWQRPFREVQSVAEVSEHWETGTFVTYDGDPELTQHLTDLIHSINPDLVTEMATDGKRVYASARGLPMWTDLDSLLGDDPHLKNAIIRNYARALRTVSDGVRLGDLIAGLSFSLRLRDDTDYFEEGRVKVAPISDLHATGSHFFGAWAVYDNLESYDPAVLRKVHNAVNGFKPADEVADARRRLEAVKDILFRDLGGNWEHLSADAVKKRLKPDRLKTFVENLAWLAEFLHEHRPDLTEAIGLTDNKGNLQMVSWNKLRDKLMAGGRGIKGRPTLLDCVAHLIGSMEGDRKSELSLLEQVFRGMTKAELRNLIKPFKDKLNEPVPQELKGILRGLPELPADLHERVNRLINAERWRDAFDETDLAEAFHFYLYTLTQVAH